MDILDIYEGRYYKTHSGTYYQRLPAPTLYTTALDLYNLEAGTFFDYEVVDPASWEYRNLIGNLVETEAVSTTIKTCEQLEFKPNEFIVLDTGKLFKIYSITEDTSAASREAARLLPIPIGTEYVLRLIEIENPRGIA